MHATMAWFLPRPAIGAKLSYSSDHQLARVIVNRTAKPEVSAPLGFVDVREMEFRPAIESQELSKELVLTHSRLLSVSELKGLTTRKPPHYGIFKVDDAEDPIFP
jgi:hypothetical protein